VLTFAYREADFNPNDPVTDLGSILICPAIAKKQAKGFHHPFEREMAFLFIHGLLHIFGYDHHAGKKDADIMFALQNKILDTLPYDFYTNIRRLKKELLLGPARVSRYLFALPRRSRRCHQGRQVSPGLQHRELLLSGHRLRRTGCSLLHLCGRAIPKTILLR
jgi:rRNA maturation RNase YbeY